MCSHLQVERKDKPVYNSESVLCEKEEKSVMEEVYLLTHSSDFKSVNNQLRSLTCNLRKDYEKHLVQGVESRPKAFWQYINLKAIIHICK